MLPSEAVQMEYAGASVCKTFKMMSTRSLEETNMDRVNTDSTYAPPTVNDGSSNEGDFDRTNTMLSIEEEEPVVTRRGSMARFGAPRRRATACPAWQDEEMWQSRTSSMPLVGAGSLRGLGLGLHLSALSSLSAWPVQNTFIHAAPLPPTPPAGSSMRSQSLPRNMGSSVRRFLVDSDTSSASNPKSPLEGSLASGAHYDDQTSVPCTPAGLGAPGRIASTPEPSPAGYASYGAEGRGRSIVLLADLI